MPKYLSKCLSFVITAGLLLAGLSCTQLKSTVQKEEIDAVDASMSLPEENITVYGDALQKLGTMLTAYHVQPIKVYCRPIVNATSSRKLPADVSQLTQTALSKIGPKVQSIDFDQTQLAVDLARNEQTVERVVPDLAVKGAITEYDAKIKKENEVEGDTLQKVAGEEVDLGGSMDNIAGSATIAIDYQLLEYRTQTAIPFVQAANRMNLSSSTQGKDFGLAVEGSGFGLNCRVKRSQGVHAGLRLLVELSVLEIIGKYHQLPYWRCLPDGTVDERVVKQFMRKLKRDPDALTTMKTLAYAHGREMDLASDGISPEELQYLRELKEEYGLHPDEENDYEFIKRMWLNLPFEAAYDRMLALPDREGIKRAAAATEVMARQKAAAKEKEKKRTTFKFGAEDSF